MFLNWRHALGLVFLVLLQGCASLHGPDPSDPLEPINRKVTAFNDVADDLVLRPVAIIYGQALPSVVRKGISNFFSNQSDVMSVFNSLAQLKLDAASRNAILRLLFLMKNETVMGIMGNTQGVSKAVNPLTNAKMNNPKNPLLCSSLACPLKVFKGNTFACL